MTARYLLSRIMVLSVPALLLMLGSAAFAPIFADSLTLSGEVPGAACNASVASGATSISCPPSTAIGITATAIGMGDLSTGVFGASTSISGNLGTNEDFVEVLYNFTVTGVSDGTAQFAISANGVLAATGCPPTICFATAYFYGLPGESIDGVVGSGIFLNSGTNNLVVDTPIGNGSAQLFFGLQLIASGVASTADFLDPTSITGGTAFDASGNPVSGATFLSQSGFNPNAVSVAPVPEPSSFLLLGTGLLGVLLTAKLKLLTA